MTRLVVLLIAALPLCAESAWHRAWRWSAAALVTGAAADVASSVGRYEMNPLARGSDGRFAVRRGIAIKAAVTGGVLLVGRLDRKAGTVANCAVGGMWAGVAVRNTRTGR